MTVAALARCKRCNSRKAVRRVKFIAVNGAVQVRDWCMDCNENTLHGVNIPHKFAGDLDAIPVMSDYSKEAHPCQVCGSFDRVEYHHYAPRHLFEDSDKWATGYLCYYHHHLWHDIVTPNMCDRRKNTDGLS